jgi:hypothetical protein
MKNKLLLLLLLVSAWDARAQIPLAQESFETDGEGVRYTSNSFDGRTSAASVAGAFPYFTRALTNPFVNPFNPAYYSFGTNAYPVTIGNVTGKVFWAAEAVESTATTPTSTDRPPGVVTLYPINASNYSSLTMTVALADARGPSSPTITQGGLNPQDETNDFIRLQYSTDGGATYNTIGQFVGNNSTGTGQGYMQRDLNMDDVITSADGAQSATNTLDINLRDFSFSIPGSPAALLVRVQIDQRGASEELAFDNIRVTGVKSTVAPPALANIESTALSYLEGQAATQITNSLTVTNSTGNLTGATVLISSGRVSTQDVLVFINQSGITGSFNTSTGVLTLAGTASAATYQAALRSIAYQNSNSANATAGTRTIQFVVANGSVTSGVASRNVIVTSALNAATTLPYREDFTTDGEGTRYASNTFTNSGTGAAWLRTNANPYQTAATSSTPTKFSGISNSFYWYGNNTNSTANPSRVATLQTLPINTAGYANLNFSLLLGASSGANASWQTADYFRMSYRQAGTNTWIPLIQFRGNSTVVAGQGNLQRDADPAATASSPVPTGTTLTPALASFNAALPSSVYGQTLEFQMVQVSDDIRAELAFDNLQLTGTQLVVSTVTTAAASSLTSTSAVLGGNVTNDGGAAVTNRGVVYSSTATTPTIGGAGVTQDANGTGTGSYSKTIAGLTPGTTYYVRAYAINSAGTSYGAAMSFATVAAATTVVSLNRVGNSPTNASTASFTVTFAAAVTGVSGSNFALATMGSVAGASITGVSGSGTTYTVAVSTGTGDGTLGLNLVNATGLSPGLTNTLPFVGQVYTIDKTAPTATLSTTAGSPTSTLPLPFTVTFSEPVTGFSASSVSVTNGTITSAIATTGNAYSFRVTPTAGGAVTVRVLANAVQDVVGNGNAAAGPLSVIYVVPCAAPTNVTVHNLTATSAQLSFTGSPTASGGYTVTATPSAGGMPLRSSGPTSPLTLSGLTPNTSYVVTVTSQCAGAQTATSDPPVAFTTPCQIPVFTQVPASQTVAADAGQCTASVRFQAQASGEPAPIITYAVNGTPITSPYTFPMGTTTVTVTATTGCGTATSSFIVTVQDRQAPTIVAAGLQAALINGTRTLEAADVDGGSYDNCGSIASMSISPRTFTCANLGPNQVTLTVTDNAGNSASQTVTVVIVDNTAPVILAAGLQINLINGTRTIEAADIDYGSYDACGSIASLTLDRTTFTCANVGPNLVTLTVTDNAGNKASQTVTVVVVDNTAPVLRVAGFTAQLQNGTRTIEAADIDYGSYDDCGSLASITISPRTFTCANVGPNLVTFTATDKAGNVSSQTVTVIITADATCSPIVTATRGQANTLEAYPNPAQDHTTLRFVAQQTGAAQLQVYNTMGERVATLYDGLAEQGQVYERTLGGTNLPAGLYTCRFIQQGQTVTQRVVLTN